VEENVNLNQSLQKMRSEELNHENVGHTSSHHPGFKDEYKPYIGEVTHCNRFNGYLGNGKYYSNEASWGALSNFFTSDCDWCLWQNKSTENGSLKIHKLAAN
jgi:hypothetical protein